MRHVGGYLDVATEEEDLLVIDDAWLKLAQAMYTISRKRTRNLRMAAFAG